MKNLLTFTFHLQRITGITALFVIIHLAVTASNPDITNYMKNLSGSLNQDGFDNKMPEIVVSGSTIHVVWLEYKYSTDCNVYYCRSTDLGKTWEKPIALIKLKDTDYGKDPRTHKLAVDGNSVHVAVPDYDYYGGCVGRIYYIRSTNGGISFEVAKELASTGGGCNRMQGSQIKAANGKVAVAYLGTGSKTGLRMLYSANNGTTFTEKLITEEPNGYFDFWYDGTQMIVVSEFIYYYYGLNVGKVFVSVSNDNAITFITNKVSTTYNESPTVVREKCRCYFDTHYCPKIAKSGNSIHVLFSGYNESIAWTALYARSTDNGLTFQKAVDINKNVLGGNAFQGGQEAIAAKNGNVYFAYLSTNGKVYFVYSSDNGATLSPARNIMSDGFTHIESTWYMNLVTDPADASGKTCYVTGQYLFSLKTTDGGKTFWGASLGAPGFMVDRSVSDLALDAQGQKHWISEEKWKGGTTYDVFYRGFLAEPAPGSENKALKIQTQYNPAVYDLTIVPSSPSLQFDSALTAEAWVKLIPLADNGSVNILAKSNGYDGSDWTPNGFNMGFRFGSGTFAINSGIETDKGDFVNWGPGNIKDTLWHHIAFTYDAKGGLENYKTYVDGLLVAKQTVTGAIIKGDGLLMIGSRNAFYRDTKYFVDNIRLWNKALSQEELLANQQKKSFTGDNRLKLNLTFDDTFKDMSGNGNDAIPLNLGEINKSDFNSPVPSFDSFRSLNEVSFNNKTTNGLSYLWDFGNKTTSTLGNPKCVYAAAGEYFVSLIASNKSTAAATTGHVTIEGLNRVEPASAGNGGYCSLLVYGGGLKVSGTTVLLRKTGSTDITGEGLSSPATGVLSVDMKVDKAVLGKWSVVVKNGTAEMVLKDAFEIMKAEQADPWVNLSGGGRILFNRWQTYTLNYGNSGNVDARSVPVWFAITDDDALEVELIDFEMVPSDLAVQKGIASQVTALGPYFKTDMVLGENMKARVYPFMVPNIPAKSAGSVHIRIKTAKSFQMKVWANPPWVEIATTGKSALLKSASSQAKLQTAECVMGVIAEGVVDIGTSAVPGVGCLWQAGKWGYQTGSNPPWSKKGSWMNTLWSACVTVVDCGINLSGMGAIYKGLGVFMANQGGYIKNIKECLELLKANSSQNMGVSAVSSFDPNEISGPKGFDTDNWIQKLNLIPYTISFENKSTATAPAHTVTITDTLDMTKFNLRDFSFSSFGWGDTIKTPAGKLLKEFSVDVDLRPVKNLITRISGKLDTIKGIVTWEFLSLNPATMQLEEDPLTGFLPPNNSLNAGQGFVSYSVGLKPELKTNTKIRNRASIVFDANKPILTNEFVNTLDTDIPKSAVLPLDATIDSRFPVTWAGTDAGSGIRNYSVFVLENDTVLSPWIINTTLTTREFEGKVGSKYKFYSLATDNVSLNEAESGYDAQTTITVFSEEFDLIRDELLLYPNPAKGSLNVQLRNAPCGMYVVELSGIDGQTYHSELYTDSSIQQGISLNLDKVRRGACFVRVIYGDRNIVRKVMVQ